MRAKMQKYLKETLKYVVRSKPLIQKEIKEIERLSLLTPDELTIHKEQQFLKIFRKAITKSKFYRRFYAEAGVTINDINSIKDLHKLPILTKDILRQNTELVPTQPSWLLISANTNGTTGNPLKLYHSYKSIKKEQAYVFINRRDRGFTYGEPLVSLKGNLPKNIFKLKVHVSNTLYLSSFNLNASITEKYYAELVKFKPKAIEGFPSSLYNLCLLLKDKKLQLQIPVAFTSSETLYDFQRELIEKTLNTKLYDYYGTTERSISLMEKLDQQGYMENPGYSINEYHKNKIITTSLIKEGFPLIRYEVNDRIRFGDNNPNPLFIQKIDGRTDDVVIAKDGSKIGRLDYLIRGINNIQNAQVVQEKIGELTINILASEAFGEDDINLIQKKVDYYIGKDNMDIKIFRISENGLIYTSGNKYKFLITRLN